eukprot:gb/GECG01006564.1/.p1 GENE.gb/GECG01006564.1/~~gb/GECG01006564.1/.p1  ORF type:complete len:160 (+),score=4.93 gb/GECG01006564.1/:1-480(+)
MGYGYIGSYLAYGFRLIVRKNPISHLSLKGCRSLPSCPSHACVCARDFSEFGPEDTSEWPAEIFCEFREKATMDEDMPSKFNSIDCHQYGFNNNDRNLFVHWGPTFKGGGFWKFMEVESASKLLRIEQSYDTHTNVTDSPPAGECIRVRCVFRCIASDC